MERKALKTIAAILINIFFVVVAFLGIGFLSIIIHFSDSPAGKLAFNDWLRSFWLSLIVGSFLAILPAFAIQVITGSRKWFFVAFATIVLAGMAFALMNISCCVALPF